MNILSRPDGRHLRAGDRIYRVLGQDEDTPFMVLEDENGSRSLIPIQDFRLAVADGDVSEARDPVFAAHSLDSRGHEEHRFRETVLKAVGRLRDEGHNWAFARAAVMAKLARDPRFATRVENFPTVRCIQMWRKNFVMTGTRALVDKRDQSGNRSDRHDAVFDEIVMEQLEKSFATSDRMTITELHRLTTDLYLARCSESGRVPGPHGRKVVQGIIADLPHSDVVKMRLGSAEARKRLNQAQRFQTIRHPYDRIEIDSSWADTFVLIDDDGNSARPHITAAIDAASGWIVGMHVSLNAPTALATALVLKEAMTPTPEAFFEEHRIQNRLQVIGLPLTVVADQGSENSGDVIRRMLATTSIEFQQVIPGHPEKKPFIERMFRSLSDFAMQLPGAAKTAEMPDRSRIDRGKAEARLTLRDFETQLQRWRFDVYGLRSRKRIQSIYRRAESPTQAWRRLQDEFLIPEPPSKRELQAIFFASRVRRKIHHYGIEVDGIQYHSTDLAYLVKTHGLREVDVWRDPTDVRLIGVVVPMSGETIYVAAKDPDLPALSIEELKRVRTALTKAAGEDLTAQEILAAATKDLHLVKHAPGSRQRDALRKARNKERNASINAATAHVQDAESRLIEEAVVAPMPVRRSGERLQFFKRREGKS